jgi:hypothetical protein
LYIEVHYLVCKIQFIQDSGLSLSWWVITLCSPRRWRQHLLPNWRIYLKYTYSWITNWLVRSLCQICRQLSRQGRCPGCTTRRWIYFAPHLGRCTTALSSRTECERYWEGRTKMMEKWLFSSLLLFLWLLLIIRTLMLILNVFSVLYLFKCSIYSVTFNILPLLVA